MNFLQSITLNRAEAARMLNTDPKALAAFEAAYQAAALTEAPVGFKANSRLAAAGQDRTPDVSQAALVEQISKELLALTAVTTVDTSGVRRTGFPEPEKWLTLKEMQAIPKDERPFLTGRVAKKEIEELSWRPLLYHYREFLKAKDPKKKQMYYNLFRQGLDILDIDPVTWAIIGTNPNSMGHWLPELADAARLSGCELKIPHTVIAKLPVSLLQMTRLTYASMNPVTLAAIDAWAMKAFALDETKDYFIKTGTYSSKFDFRNAHVSGAKEVRELGEYLLYIHSSACQMAGPLYSPCIYGVSTTNEWVVREWIEPVEERPCIYHGLPLRTEYRVFIDADENEILGISPYWRADVMKGRFDKNATPDDVHDSVTYRMAEPALQHDYAANKDRVLEQVRALLPELKLSGQWSLDIMQNGDDLYAIDMAQAANSALKDCVPVGRLKPVAENWLPDLNA